MHRISKALLGIVLLATLAIPGIALAHGSHSDGSNGNTGSKPSYDHVFVIVEENTAASEIIGDPNAPTFNQLAQTYGLATHYYGVTHPSEPNYVAMIGGSYHEIQDDASYTTHQIDSPSLVDQLEGADLTWKGYFQTMPSPGFEGKCFPTTTNCLYASKHNPFMNFTHVSTSNTEKANLVPDTQLMADLSTGDVPNFSYIIPDQCHDIHGQPACPDKETNIKVGDEYLATVVTAIRNSKVWQQGHNAIVVTFDEDDFNPANLGCCDANPGGGPVYTVVVTNHQQKPIQDPTPYNHYSLLASVEKAFGLGCLQATCDTAAVKPMDPLFGIHPIPNK